jgi:hypothetical protein
LAILNGYCLLSELKAEQNIPDTADDASLEQAIETASRAVDETCGRVFYQEVAQTRYYTAEDADLLFVDDLVSVTTLAVDINGSRTYDWTWSTTDYDLEPYNAALHSKPYLWIRRAYFSQLFFPTLRKGVKLVGTFGWPAVPPQAKRACMIQAARYWKRKDAVFGVMGSAEMGQVVVLPKLDPDVITLVTPLMRPGVIGI